MQPLQQGLLIVIEGIDGSGKTTLAQNLYRMLEPHYDILLTKEPGGTPLGQHIRTLLQYPVVPLAPTSEYLLFAADRAQHFHELIIPALDDKKLVISDRMSDSSLVYQAYAKKLNEPMIRSINTWVMQGNTPDLTIYVHISAEKAYDRMKHRGALTGMEKNQLPLMQTFVDGFERLYQSNQAVYRVDGLLSENQMTQQTYEYIKKWIIRYHLI